NKLNKLILLITLGVGFLGNVLAASSKTLSFATEATYPPFEVVASTGILQGFDVDIANAICNHLKVKCVFINQPFDSLIPNLNMDKFDAIIAAMNITADRAKSVDFTNAYYKNTASFVAKNKTNFTLNKAGLKGKVIGVQQGTTFLQYLKKTYGDSVTVETYASAQSAFIDMASGRIDAVLGDSPIMQQWLNEHGKGQFHFVGKPVYDATYFGAGYGIAVKKGNTATLKEINQGLSAIEKDGTLAKIQNKYFSK
ncbi:MAG: transporter substrate-binding domain-containing protein, partial [Burkholderiales bacterium]|nr:transporter substrate-binding domain-containing protein [Burkholderiales bacterium]